MTDIFYSLGRSDALSLRRDAHTMDGTAVIAQDFKAPKFNPKQDYSKWPVGAPVRDDGQTWQLIQPHNAANYSSRPADLRALWSLCHTKDPAKARPWVDPAGTSGMYMIGEVYRAEDGTVYRAKQNNLVYDAITLPEAWEKVEVKL